MNWEMDNYDTLQTGDDVFEFPYGVSDIAEADGILVVNLGSINTASNDSASFELISERRNVLGFSESGHEWHVEPAPDDRSDPEHVGYRRLIQIEDSVYVQYITDRPYEINHQTGKLVDSWASDCLPLGDRVVNLTGTLHELHEDDDRIYVRTRDGEHDFVCFDKSGERLWASDDWHGTLHLEDDLYEYEEQGPRTCSWYRLDKDTGERIEEVEKPDLSNPFL